MSCDKCGSPTHRDDAMNRRCNSCEHLVRQCDCACITYGRMLELCAKENEMTIRSIHVTKSELSMIKNYDRAGCRTTYVIHTPSASAIGGFSCEFVEFMDYHDDNAGVLLKMANGDHFIVPLSEVTIRVQF